MQCTHVERASERCHLLTDTALRMSNVFHWSSSFKTQQTKAYLYMILTVQRTVLSLYSVSIRS